MRPRQRHVTAVNIANPIDMPHTCMFQAQDVSNIRYSRNPDHVIDTTRQCTRQCSWDAYIIRADETNPHILTTIAPLTQIRSGLVARGILGWGFSSCERPRSTGSSSGGEGTSTASVMPAGCRDRTRTHGYTTLCCQLCALFALNSCLVTVYKLAMNDARARVPARLTAGTFEGPLHHSPGTRKNPVQNPSGIPLFLLHGATADRPRSHCCCISDPFSFIVTLIAEYRAVQRHIPG